MTTDSDRLEAIKKKREPDNAWRWAGSSVWGSDIDWLIARVEELEADLPSICGVDGCELSASCGTPTDSGYKITCHLHIPEVK